MVFELNANDSTWAKWDLGNTNDWDEISKILSSIISIDQAAASVIKNSGKSNTFIQKIDYLHDRSEPLYQGEAFNLNEKFVFEINAKNGSFKKFTRSTGDETFKEKYADVAPSGSGSTTEPPVTETPATEAPATVKGTRLSGDNRYKTAIAISKQRASKAGIVLLANGMSQIDALSAAPLAQKHSAPLLLTGGKSLEAEVKAEIARLGATKVILIGGTGSIAPSIESGLRNSGLTVERLQGDNRYKTSAVLTEALGSTSKRAFIANGISAVDALGIGPYAAQNGIPILLTSGTALDEDVEKSLSGVTQITVIGGNHSVSEALLSKLRAKEITVNRVAGNNRYQTSGKIAEAYYPNTSKAVFATGAVLADGLAGAGLAADNKAPLLLVGTNVDQTLSSYLKAQSFDSIYVLGGTNSITDAVYQALLAAAK